MLGPLLPPPLSSSATPVLFFLRTSFPCQRQPMAPPASSSSSSSFPSFTHSRLPPSHALPVLLLFSLLLSSFPAPQPASLGFAAAARVPPRHHALISSPRNRSQSELAAGSQSEFSASDQSALLQDQFQPSVDQSEPLANQSEPPAAPVWPPRFQIDFDEETYFGLFTLRTGGRFWLDFGLRRQRMDRENGRGDRYCGSALPLASTPCTHLIVNGWRYLVFPRRKYCCKCCSSAHGCGMVRPDWLTNATYIGRDEVDGINTTKWNQPGIQNNFYWHSEDDVPMKIYMEPLEQMTFHRESIFSLPPGPDCSSPCYGTCALLASSSSSSS